MTQGEDIPLTNMSLVMAVLSPLFDRITQMYKSLLVKTYIIYICICLYKSLMCELCTKNDCLCDRKINFVDDDKVTLK